MNLEPRSGNLDVVNGKTERDDADRTLRNGKRFDGSKVPVVIVHGYQEVKEHGRLIIGKGGRRSHTCRLINCSPKQLHDKHKWSSESILMGEVDTIDDVK